MNELYSTNNTSSIPTCNERPMINPEPQDESRGLYAISQDTYECLHEVLAMLNVFADEIEAPTEKRDWKFEQPVTFTDNINKNSDLAFAIRGDLQRLICKFRR